MNQLSSKRDRTSEVKSEKLGFSYLPINHVAIPALSAADRKRTTNFVVNYFKPIGYYNEQGRLPSAPRANCSVAGAFEILNVVLLQLIQNFIQEC